MLLLVLASLLQPGIAGADVQDFYLHGSGGTDNPPTLFLDKTAPPTATEKFKDSTSINLSGGNPWKEVGTWPAASSLTAGSRTLFL